MVPTRGASPFGVFPGERLEPMPLQPYLGLLERPGLAKGCLLLKGF